VVAPARKPDNEIALTQTPGGFGTPPFEYQGRRLQVRVDGPDLVVAEDGSERRQPIESIAAAAAFVGADLYPGGLPGDAATLSIDPPSASGLGDFYAFAARILAALRETMPPADEPSEINLWPEHFDIAFEAGSEQLGRRANYGASPGDAEHPEPYVYVGPWQAQPAGELWNASGFAGAELPFADLVSADDPEGLASQFLVARRDALGA
jgi:hypothetical protein